MHPSPVVLIHLDSALLSLLLFHLINRIGPGPPIPLLCSLWIFFFIFVYALYPIPNLCRLSVDIIVSNFKLPSIGT